MGSRAASWLFVCPLPRRLRFPFEEGNPVRVPLIASELIDGSMPGSRCDPRSRVIGNTVLRPALESDGEGILYSFFRKIDIAESARARDATARPDSRRNRRSTTSAEA